MPGMDRDEFLLQGPAAQQTVPVVAVWKVKIKPVFGNKALECSGQVCLQSPLTFI